MGRTQRLENLMNKRIKELLKQSGLQPYYDAQEGQIEKFAELIVRECAAYIDDNIGYDDCNNTYPVSGGELKDHFGVEE